MPDSDGTTTSTFGSGSANWDRINSGILGGTPDDTNGIYVIDGDEWRGGFINPSFVGTCLEIKVHVRAKERTSGPADFTVELYSDGATLDYDDFFSPTGSYANFTLTPSTPIAKTAAQLTNLEVLVKGESASWQAQISEVEVELVLTSSSSSSFSSCSSSFSSSSFSSSSSSSCSSSSCSSSSSSFSSSSSQSFEALQSQYILPNQKISPAIWSKVGSCTDYDCINSGINSGTPDDSTFLFLLDTEPNDGPRMGFENPSFVGTCVEIKVNIRAENSFGTTGDIRVRLYSDGTNVDGDDNWPAPISWGNHTFTFQVAKTAAQLTNLQVRVDSSEFQQDDYLSEVEVQIVLPSSSSSSSCSSSFSSCSSSFSSSSSSFSSSSSSSFSSSSSSFSSSSSSSSCSSSFSSSCSSAVAQSLFILPDGDVLTQATFGAGSANYDRINDGIDSGTPDDTNGIVGSDGDRWRGTFTSPSFSGSCTNIIVRFRAKNDDGSDGVKVTLYSNGVDSDGQSGNFFPATSYTDYEENYTLSKTAAQLTSLEVRIDTASSFEDWISEIEVEIVLPSSSSSSSSSTST